MLRFQFKNRILSMHFRILLIKILQFNKSQYQLQKSYTFIQISSIIWNQQLNHYIQYERHPSEISFNVEISQSILNNQYVFEVCVFLLNQGKLNKDLQSNLMVLMDRYEKMEVILLLEIQVAKKEFIFTVVNNQIFIQYQLTFEINVICLKKQQLFQQIFQFSLQKQQLYD
ncbi:unnamed protein product (macronuclear) [Paramecium tetraurelia]|uniref:Transmembrane protein n=1 Tax=Paramecium tetraurelia TaxID=5888 RepID=A0BVT7_PARTE|nr:uncharacterized protein GSPATT00032506001 [Paramecium tetraurelia]CAK62654.1 unnamed protein product [Paramecium tetraurelia]|eukprot:XP_001430052.1 hypothetical protein (macronuclear) [Paramecium tetraurelia strain d4-2]